jgi:glycosyltransferase involved in cell wall biosynthesis
MKNVLLISNYVYHYRINNYNYFYKKFAESGINFQVLADGFQEVDYSLSVKCTRTELKIGPVTKFIKKNKPDCIILFLHLKDRVIFPLLFYCRLKGIPVVYWNFGIDLGEPDHKVKNFLYRRIHSLANSILLYSPNEKKYIKSKHHKKTFVANNTINMTEFSEVAFSGNHLKEAYKIKEKNIILFVGRIIKVKRVDSLLRCFRNNPDVAVVIAGKGMPDEMLDIVDRNSNYYYLGEIKYDKLEMAKIYSSADIVCIPGNVGLAIIEAFFWGKPLVTLKSRKGLNSPEIWYLLDGENGYISENEEDMELKILDLLSDSKLYNKFSKKAKDTSNNEAHIDQMHKGFMKAIDFVSSNNKYL